MLWARFAAFSLEMASDSDRPASAGTATPLPDTLSTIGVVSGSVAPAVGLVLTTWPFLKCRLATGFGLVVTFFQPSLWSWAVASLTDRPDTSGNTCAPGLTL